MATGANRRVAVLVEPLPDGQVIACDRRHVAGVGWRRGRRGVPQRVQYIGRPADRQGPIPVAEEREHAGHPENAAAVMLRRDRDLSKRASLDAVDAVMSGEPLIDHYEVAVHEVEDREILLEYFLKELVGFTA